MPKLSIVIPTFNRHKSLFKTLESIIPHYNNDIEIVVVDQSKTSVDYKEKFPMVNFYLLPKPSLPKARNFGIRKSLGDLILFLDDDMRIDKNTIEEHFNAHQNKSIGIVSGRIIQKGSDYWANINIPSYINWKNVETKANFDLDKNHYIEYASGGHFSIKRSVLKKTGLFNPRFGGNALYEDVDISMRIKKAGYSLFYNSNAISYHFSFHSGGCHNETKTNHLLWRLHNQTLFYLLYKYPIMNFEFLNYQKNLIEYISRNNTSSHNFFLIFKSFLFVKKAFFNSLISRIINSSL